MSGTPESSDGDNTRSAHTGRAGRPRALTVLAVLGVAMFALWGIGAPLIGTSTLTATNEMVAEGPWVFDGFAASTPTNTWLDDTFTAQLPSTILFLQQLAQGHVAEWNPYGAGGTPLAALPDFALFSPLTVPFYVLPAWLAPAYERLLEIVVAAGGCFLFLRRVALSRAAALTGGLVYASSGFMVAWLGFPQTRVAAFIPVLFWAIERFLQLRRLRDAAFVAVPIAALLLGGFPSVTGYALLTALAYVLVRLISLHRREPLRLIRPVLCLAGSLVAGIGLALFQLVPFLTFFDARYISGRDQTGDLHLVPSSLVTMVAPYAFGYVDPARDTQFTLPQNFVEATSYLGVAATVLALVAIALARQGRALLPTGVWVFLVVGSVLWAALIYLGGPPLEWLQDTPGLRAVFGINFVGRARSILGFLLAALAATGFELLVRQRVRHPESVRGRRIWAAGVVVVSTALAGVLVWQGGRDTAAGARTLIESVAAATTLYRQQIIIAAVLLAVAVSCVLLLRYAGMPSREGRRRWVRFGAAAVLLALITGQGIHYVVVYYPRSPVQAFYPVSDTHRYLAANLGHQRYASSQSAMVLGTNTAYGLRSVNGHAFINSDFATLAQGIPDNPLPYPTYIDFNSGDLAQATSPVLDLLGTAYYVESPLSGIFGTVHAATGTGTMTLTPGQPVTAPLPTTGPLRGIGFTAMGDVPPGVAALDDNAYVDVVIRDANGMTLASSRKLTAYLASNAGFEVAVAGESIPAGTPETATITLHGSAPLTVAATDSTPAVTSITPGDDGLRLVYAGSTVIYQRLHAQPRIRFAAHSEVVRDAGKRVALLSSGAVAPDTVVLSAPGPVAAGQPGTVRMLTDGTDSVSASVTAGGFGYLVIADADQVGWAATVDGRPAPLVAADEGLVAVPVPAGQHTVLIHYSLRHGRAGAVASIGTAAVLVLLCLFEWLWGRRSVPQQRQ